MLVIELLSLQVTATVPSLSQSPAFFNSKLLLDTLKTLLSELNADTKVPHLLLDNGAR